MKIPCVVIFLAFAIAFLLVPAFGGVFDGEFGGEFGGEYGGGYGYPPSPKPRPKECEARDIIELEAYIGWPIRLSCAKLAYDYSDVAFNQFLISTPPPEHKDTHCLIVDKDTNTTIMDEDHEVWSWKKLGYKYPYKLMDDITAKSSSRYMLQLKTLSTCTYEDLTLKIQKTPIQTCKEVTAKEEHAIYRVDIESSEHVIDCEVNYYQGRMVTSLDHNVHKYSVIWYKNCRKINMKKSKGAYVQKGDRLTFGMVDYGMNGMYSCQILYKGKKRTGRIVDLCVRPPRVVKKPVIRCPKMVRAKINSTASVDCTVILSYRPLKEQKYSVQWKQEVGKSRHLCRESGQNEPDANTTRSNCSSNVQLALECFSRKPTRKQQETKFVVTFSVQNFVRADAGKYSALFLIGQSNVKFMWRMQVQREKKDKGNEKQYGKKERKSY